MGDRSPRVSSAAADFTLGYSHVLPTGEFLAHAIGAPQAILTFSLRENGHPALRPVICVKLRAFWLELEQRSGDRGQRTRE
jgi:hypothetical protein